MTSGSEMRPLVRWRMRAHVIGDLVHGGIDECHELDFGNGLEAPARHADGHSGDHAFGERRVLHAILAELLLQAGGGPEHAAVHADVLAEHHDRRVAAPSPTRARG